jgi:phosphoserine phosphatase
MDSVIVVIAAPGSGAIDGRVETLLRQAGAAPRRWLAAGEALEADYAGEPAALRKALAGLPLDIAGVPAAGRRKKLLLADMDSTMICQECIDELGAAAGVGQRIAAITARAMRGELDFEGALKERLALLRGLDAAVIDRIIHHRITFMPGGATLIATMKAHGARAALISGGFSQFTGAVAQRLDFDSHEANELIIEDGRLSGMVREPILGKDAKLASLRRQVRELGIAAADVIAVGDGANDIPMLLAAGMGVALHAKPRVQEQARIAVNHGDLTALLYLQGYSAEEFVRRDGPR